MITVYLFDCKWHMLLMFYIVNIQEWVDMSNFEKSHVMCSVCGTDNNNYYSLGVKFSSLHSNSVQSQFVVLTLHQPDKEWIDR